jgi:tetraacyldisaccharide 4'-kinase
MRIELVWYKKNLLSWFLWPLSVLFRLFVGLRRWCYRKGIARVVNFPVKIVVVGNITVGGTGKSPLIIHLVGLLRRNGLNVGIVSRGYGGKSAEWPCTVTDQSDPSLVGDEAVMLAKATQCPMVVAPSRVAAVACLLKNNSLDVVLSDDGLQHYALGRDVEIVVVDSTRGFGNGFLLPAGPLREPSRRLKKADFVIYNGGYLHNDYTMDVVIQHAYHLPTGRIESLSYFKGKSVIAVAGIGHPQRFFESLKRQGVCCVERSFPDHYEFSPSDLHCGESELILMTEKDAVKCSKFVGIEHVWCVSISVVSSIKFQQNLLEQILYK